MDVENIFRDVKLSKTEMTVLRFIQNDPEQCIRQGVRAVAEQCYSNPSSLVRLAKKLKFSGWLELVYFIKFNITMPKLDVTNDIDYMSVQPEEALTPLLASLKQQRILIHGSGFSQLIAQYIYNKFLVTGVNASLALWPDYEILDAIVRAYMEEDRSPREIIAAGLPEADVRRVVRLLRIAEYKRRQAPVGIRITPRGFGKDWRYPITNQFRA